MFYTNKLAKRGQGKMNEEFYEENQEIDVPSICNELFYNLASPDAGKIGMFMLGKEVANAPEQDEEDIQCQ